MCVCVGVGARVYDVYMAKSEVYLYYSPRTVFCETVFATELVAPQFRKGSFLASPRDPPISTFPVGLYECVTVTFFFLMSVQDLDLGPYACWKQALTGPFPNSFR